MKKTIPILLCIFLFMSTNAQIKVEKSKEVIVVLGRKYFIHSVKKGETLHSISNVYEVSQDQVILINNEEVKNLKSDDILKIPIIDKNYKKISSIEITFTEYVVGKKESLYSIAKRHNVTEQDIIKYNPKVAKGVKKKQILKIPVFNQIEIKAEDDFFIYHQVKQGETINSIIKKYNITKKQLVLMNPETEKKLEVGKVLSIPKKELTELEFLIISGNESQIPDLINVDPLYFTDPSCKPCSEFMYSENKVFKVALLIPFFVDLNYTKSFNVIEEPDKLNYYKNSELFFHFYEGALLAVNEMRRLGLSIDLHVYDTQNDSATVANIFSKYEMKNMDLIIGPIYSNNIDIVANFANENRINVVLPVSKKTEHLKENPFLFQVNPSNNMLIKNTTEYFTDYYDSSLVVIHGSKEKEMELLEVYRKNLINTFFQNTDLDTIALKDVMYNKDGMKGVRGALKKEQSNIVFIPSTNEVFVSNVLNQLNTLVSIEKYKITVYGMPAWEAFNDLELVFFENLDIHYPSPSYIDDKDWQVEKFNTDFRTTFNGEPSVFSYQGYDVTLYFLTALKRYGKYFQFCISDKDMEPSPQGLSLKFDFKRVDKHGGFENNGGYLLHFDKKLDLKKLEK